MADSKLEDLKDQNPILEVAIRLGIQIKSSGGTTTKSTLCPFHDDHNPSLVFMPDVNRFECKSCGEKGDVIDFIKGIKKCDFKEALVWLDPGYYKNSIQVGFFNAEDYLEKRGINQDSVEKYELSIQALPYGIHTGEKVVAIPVPSGTKYRLINCKHDQRYCAERGTKDCIYKTRAPLSKTIIFTAGELDAIITTQKTGAPCWTNTAGEKEISRQFIADFDDLEKIYLAQDNDEPGEKAAKLVAAQLGARRCFRLRVPKEIGKDWTDYFISGKTKEDFIELLKRAPLMENDDLSQRLEDQLLEPDLKIYSGLKKLDYAVEGFRGGRLYLLGGLKKSGKSSLMMHILNDVINQGIKVGFINTELTFKSLIARFAAIENNITVQEAEKDPSYSRVWLKRATPNFFYIDKSDIQVEAELSLEKVTEILNSWIKKGVKLFAFDNLTTFNTQSSQGLSGWEILGQSINKLVDVARDNGIVGFAVIHTKPSLTFNESPEGIRKLIEGNNADEIFKKSITINRRPSASDLYGGGSALSQVSGILLIWRPFQDINKSDFRSKALLILEDFRDGSLLSEIRLNFDGLKVRFTEENYLGEQQ